LSQLFLIFPHDAELLDHLRGRFLVIDFLQDPFEDVGHTSYPSHEIL